MDMIIQIAAAAMSAGTPLLFAVLGGILIERSGIIQLGAEGVMLMGAATSALFAVRTGNLAAALFAALAVSASLGLLHGFLTVSLRVNQIVSGLAMTLFGSGLSAFLGRTIAGQPVPAAVPKLDMPLLDGVPVIGPLLGHLDALTWLSFALVIGLHLYLYRTSWGLHLRALGDNPPTADVMGIPVTAFRYGCVIVGTMLIGLGGADLLLVFSPAWIEGMTAGRGWIAVALIIFARWNPLRALPAAYLFGALDALGFRIQLIGSDIPSYFLKMIPYAITILVLMVLGRRNRGRPSGSPESLGVPYIREQRL